MNAIISVFLFLSGFAVSAVMLSVLQNQWTSLAFFFVGFLFALSILALSKIMHEVMEWADRQ